MHYPLQRTSPAYCLLIFPLVGVLAQWYYGGMKEKTSITLSPDILAKVDHLAGSKLSRSALIEQVLRNYFRERTRRKLQARDLERINAAADRLNSEAAEVLEYQSSEG